MNVDGLLDEPCWKEARPTLIKYVFGKLGVVTPKPQMIARFTWDDHYFYIGYETFDENLVAVGKDEMQGPKGNKRQCCEIWSSDPKPMIDVVEFFITFGDEKFFWEIHHNAANQFNDVLIIRNLPAWKKFRSFQTMWDIYFGHQEYIQDEEEYTLKMAVRMKPKADGTPSTVNDDSDTDTGYTAEIRVPWFGINTPLRCRAMNEFPPEEGGKRPIRKPGPWQMNGQEIWICAVYQNPDRKDRYFHSSPLIRGGWFHHNVTRYLRYRLKGKNTPPIKLAK